MINSISDAIRMITDGQGFGIGAQFHNVSKAQIYGVEISTNGVYNFNKNTKLFYNLGYVYTEPVMRIIRNAMMRRIFILILFK
jgi:hypothetical protein